MVIAKIFWTLIMLEIFSLFVLNIADEKDIKRCGRSLTEALKAICDSNYNGLNGGGGSTVTVAIVSDDQSSFTEDNDEYQGIVFISKLTGGVLRPNVRRRRRRGIVEECCRKPCDYKELRTYCLPSS